MKTGVLSMFLLALFATDTLATARHDRPRTSPLKQGGKTKGVNISLTVYPESYSNVKIGLGKMKATVPAGTSDSMTYKRQLAAGVRKGYLRVKLGERHNLSNQTYELKFKVPYSKANGLKPGMKVDVVSAFYNQATYFHVYGMYDGPVNQGDSSSVITLPK